MNVYRSKDTATDATVETGPTRSTRHIIVTGD